MKKFKITAKKYIRHDGDVLEFQTWELRDENKSLKKKKAGEFGGEQRYSSLQNFWQQAFGKVMPAELFAKWQTAIDAGSYPIPEQFLAILEFLGVEVELVISETTTVTKEWADLEQLEQTEKSLKYQLEVQRDHQRNIKGKLQTLRRQKQQLQKFVNLYKKKAAAKKK